jgi:hypothetical protein
MKRSVVIIGSVILGCIVGAIVGALITANYPVCGDECGMRVLGSLTRSVLGSALLYCVTMWFATKRAMDWRKVCALLTVNTLLLLTPSAIYYVRELHQERDELKKQAPLKTDLERPFMIIAKRDIQTYSSVSEGKLRPLYKIESFERCTTSGSAICDSKPRQLEVMCNVGKNSDTGYINDEDWPAFNTVPKENFKFPTEWAGQTSLEQKNLCKKSN